MWSQRAADQSEPLNLTGKFQACTRHSTMRPHWTSSRGSCSTFLLFASPGMKTMNLHMSYSPQLSRHFVRTFWRQWDYNITFVVRLYIIIQSLSTLFIHHYGQWFITCLYNTISTRKPNHLKYILTVYGHFGKKCIQKWLWPYYQRRHF